jgi:5-methyltetrahydropteroyltriglutamate--homocysteine methyltransferase
MTSTATFPRGTILGYPRIGRRRELKKAVEAFWGGEIGAAELEARAASLRAAIRAGLSDLGLGRNDSSIPESFSYPDQVLDAAVMFDAIPARFANLLGHDGALDLAGYFTLARGEGERAPLEMTTWFDSNCHYPRARPHQARRRGSRPAPGRGAPVCRARARCVF